MPSDMTNSRKKEQNEISLKFLEGSDLLEREKEVLEDASNRLNFKPTELMGRSSWWGSSQVGAVFYIGEFEGKKVVLKIQGVEPTTSEADMINEFRKANRSRIVRPPYLYSHLAWDENKRYEALVMEFIEGKKIIAHLPAEVGEIRRFFDIYSEYRENCISRPWIEKPTLDPSQKIEENFGKWRKASFEIYPDHPLRLQSDLGLIDEAVSVLKKNYQGIEPEFVHGHLSDGDFYEAGDQVIVLSNLYWSWRAPFYDGIFGYHWYMYHLSDVDGITSKEVEDQRTMWMGHIEKLAEQDSDKKKLLNLAFLERAAAGLNLDALTCNPEKPISKFLVERTRSEVVRLLHVLH